MTPDPRFIAGVQLLERTGARNFRIGYSDEADGEPIVWYACATWKRIKAPAATWHGDYSEAAGALDPTAAVIRLCELVVDGGTCTHCGRPTIFDDNVSDTPIDALFNEMGCVYGWDPELATFRRGCEGD
jgi:hypothetical protein